MNNDIRNRINDITNRISDITNCAQPCGEFVISQIVHSCHSEK